jgi:hypothetical protein
MASLRRRALAAAGVATALSGAAAQTTPIPCNYFYNAPDGSGRVAATWDLSQLYSGTAE